MADLTSVVEQAGKWPVGVAAAAAVGPRGVLASTGPVNRQFPLASVTKPLAVLSALPLRESSVLRLRFGLDDGRPRTLDEVGRVFGVTRERVRQIQNIALKKLRKMIEKMETTKS